MKRIAASILLLLAATVASSVPAAADAKAAKPEPVFGDWAMHCREISPGDTACLLHQKIVSSETKMPVAAFAVARNPDSHELRLTAVLPLGLDIPAGVIASADGKALPLTVQTCVRRGCVASLTVDDKVLERLHGAQRFTVTFHMRGVADAATLTVSLKGLEDGLKALAAR